MSSSADNKEMVIEMTERNFGEHYHYIPAQIRGAIERTYLGNSVV